MKLILTNKAKNALEKQSPPLRIVLELLFSCMIRKRVLFVEKFPPDTVFMDTGNSHLQVAFRAVATKTCLISDQPVPDLETFPVKRIEAFLPRWFKLDHIGGKWLGEFGYADAATNDRESER